MDCQSMTQHPANNPSAAETELVEGVVNAPASAGAAAGAAGPGASTDVESLLDELERLSDETDVWAGVADEAAQSVGEGVAVASQPRIAATEIVAEPVKAAAAAPEPDPADSEEALRQLDSVLAQAADSLADGVDAEEAIAEANASVSAGEASATAAGEAAGAASRIDPDAAAFSTVDDVVREVAAEFDAGEAPPESSAPARAVATVATEPARAKPADDPEASRLLTEKESTRHRTPEPAPGAGKLGLLLAPLALLALPMKLLPVGAREMIGHLALVTVVCGGGVWYAVKHVPRESAPLSMGDLVVFKTKEDPAGHGADAGDGHGGGGKKAPKDAHGKGDGHGSKPAEKKGGSSGHAKPAAKGGKDKKDAKGGGHH